MNQRDIVRIRREHGIKYFALPLLALLAVAVVADHWLGDYGERRAQAQELRDTLERQRAVLDLQPQVAANEERLKPLYSAAEPRLFISETSGESAQAMRQQLQQLLQSLYFDQIDILEVAELPAGQLTRLNELGVLMGATRNHFQKILGCNDCQGKCLHVAIDGREKDPAAGFHKLCA